ncbi:hypothetical protein HMPREF9069_00926 [Atopobium sp. oral taxon 810 str. F0209]|nr:hypothetical protein HMPREF9069_00926 [Atopobium sp. oral taxon 810 str. F0209]
MRRLSALRGTHGEIRQAPTHARRRGARVAWGRPPLRGAHGARVPAARARARGAPPRAQVHARAGRTRRDAQCREAPRDTRWARAPEAGPGGARPHRPRARLQARRRHHLPAHGAGLAVPGHRDRPQHPHGGRVGVCPGAWPPTQSSRPSGRPAGAATWPRGPSSTATATASTPRGCWRRGPGGNDVGPSCGRTGSRHDDAVVESSMVTVDGEFALLRVGDGVFPHPRTGGREDGSHL